MFEPTETSVRGLASPLALCGDGESIGIPDADGVPARQAAGCTIVPPWRIA